MTIPTTTPPMITLEYAEFAAGLKALESLQPQTGPTALVRGSLTRSSTASTVTTLSSITSTSTTATLVNDGPQIKAVPSVLDTNRAVCHECGVSVPALPLASPGQLSDLAIPGTDFPLKPLISTLKSHLATQLARVTPRPAPKLVGLLATDDAGCRSYANATAKTCRTNGIEFTTLEVPREYEAVKRAIMSCNEDESVSGLIVYLPIFGLELDGQLRRLIGRRIDVEGVNPASLAVSSRSIVPMLQDEIHGPDAVEAAKNVDESVIHPCTALAVVRILQSHPSFNSPTAPPGRRLSNRVITILNRSETVGKPLAMMLANEGATVFSADLNGLIIYQSHAAGSVCSRVSHMAREAYLGMSDVIVSAVPSPTFKIPTDMIKQGAICVNVAMDENFEGDVKRRAGSYVRRVGGVTTLMLQLNGVGLAMRRGEPE